MALSYTLLPKLRTDRQNADGTHTLLIVVTIQRVRYLVNLGRNLLPTEWDDVKKKAKGPRAAALNSVVARKHAELTAILEEVDRKGVGPLTMAGFRAALDIKPLRRLKIVDYLNQEMLGDKAFQTERTPSTLKRINEAFKRIHK